MRVNMKILNHPIRAQFEDVGKLKKMHEGVWKISITYCSKRSGEIFKSGEVMFNPCLWDEVQQLCKEIIKRGGIVLEVKTSLINKIINV